LGSFKKSLKIDELSKAALQLWVLTLREEGLKITSVISYARGVNSFLSWLSENEYIQQRLQIKILKEPEKVLKVFSDQQLRALLPWKPKGFCQQRLYALVTLIIDTGCRIDECLSLTRSGLDFDNLLVTVQGEGSKERIIPSLISIALLQIHTIHAICG
jgi:site-specific recombinase XerD